MRAGIMLVTLLAVTGAAAAQQHQQEAPGAAFCWRARALLSAAGSERAAEQAARAMGASDEIIAKARRCKR